MNVKLPQKHKKNKQVEVLEIKESKNVEPVHTDEKKADSEKVVSIVEAQKPSEVKEEKSVDWQQHDVPAEKKQPEVINIEHIDLEFSTSHAVQLDDVPFEFDYSKRENDGGEY